MEGINTINNKIDSDNETSDLNSDNNDNEEVLLTTEQFVRIQRIKQKSRLSFGPNDTPTFLCQKLMSINEMIEFIHPTQKELSLFSKKKILIKIKVA